MNTMNNNQYDKTENVDHAIEGLLFIAGEPISYDILANHLKISHTDVQSSCSRLSDFYRQRGMRIITDGVQAQLATAPDIAEVVKGYVSEDLEGELTKATAEVLAIIAYRGPATRAEIESIRGVNCSSPLRKLLLRRLIERTPNPFDARSYRYRITLDTLRTLGLERIEDLPEYQELSTKNEGPRPNEEPNAKISERNELAVNREETNEGDERHESGKAKQSLQSTENGTNDHKKSETIEKNP